LVETQTTRTNNTICNKLDLTMAVIFSIKKAKHLLSRY